MRYFVNLDPTPGTEPIVVEVTERPSGALDVTVGGRKADVDVVALGTALSIRVDGRMVDLTTEGQPPELGAIASGHRSYVRVESERQRAADAAKRTTSGGSDKVLRSPMPGRVVRIFVGPKDEVTAGQTLCVIEAMKMENEVKAKTPCVISEVHVTEGATVESNGKIFTLQ